jgi:hypothetical protein
MCAGESAAFHSPLDMQSQYSIGVDCHSNNSASIPSELRIMLQSARAANNEKFIAAGKFPLKVYKTVQEAFNLATLVGTRATGRGKVEESGLQWWE